VLFKIGALVTFICGSWVVDNFVIEFVVCILLLAFDFWTVKNVTGRLLVGLRWWNEVKEDGSNVWVFESKPDNRTVHPRDSYVFWGALYGTPLIWLVFGIVDLALVKFRWVLIVVVSLILSGANVVGYWKCQKDAKQKITSFIAHQL